MNLLQDERLSYLLLVRMGFNIFSSPTAWLTWTPPSSRSSGEGARSVLRRVVVSNLLWIFIVSISVVEYHSSSLWRIMVKVELTGTTVSLEAKRTVRWRWRLGWVSTMSWFTWSLGALFDDMVISSSLGRRSVLWMADNVGAVLCCRRLWANVVLGIVILSELWS